MKKLLSILLVSAMLFAVLPFAVNVSAEGLETIRFVVGNGGIVAVNSNIHIEGGAERNVFAPNGTLNCVAAPDEGFQLNMVLIDGEKLEVSGNSFTVEGLASNQTVLVSFKPIADVDGITIDDIDWSSQDIVVPVSSEKPVLNEVFEKIRLLPEGSFVEFKSENGSIFVPAGKAISANGFSAYMNIATMVGGNRVEEIKKSVQLRLGANATFNLYGILADVVLPDGTEIAFNLGGDFANSETTLYNFNESLNYAYNKATGTVDANGLTERFAYGNEKILICSLNKPVEYNISVSKKGDGGSVTPEGMQTASAGGSVEISISAESGYVIKSVSVDGNKINIDNNLTLYTYKFENITANHTLVAEFKLIPAATVGVIVPDESGDLQNDAIATEVQGGTNVAWILLVIGGIALLIPIIIIVVIIIIIVSASKKKKKKNKEIAERAAAELAAAEAALAKEAAEKANAEAVEETVESASVTEEAAQPAEVPVAPVAPEFKFCPQCGTKLASDSAFCGNCGTKQ